MQLSAVSKYQLPEDVEEATEHSFTFFVIPGYSQFSKTNKQRESHGGSEAEMKPVTSIEELLVARS